MAAIEIGNTSKEHILAMKEAICSILAQGHASHTPQESLNTALMCLTQACKVEHVSIMNCSFTGCGKEERKDEVSA